MIQQKEGKCVYVITDVEAYVLFESIGNRLVLAYKNIVIYMPMDLYSLPTQKEGSRL